MRKALTLSAALALALAVSFGSAVHAADDEGDGVYRGPAVPQRVMPLTVPAPAITSPLEGEQFAPGTIPILGNASGAAAADSWIVYVMDVSGSTAYPGYDCNNSGAVDAADDFNGNASNGEVVDCEIAGMLALNDSIAAAGDPTTQHIAVIVFGVTFVTADVTPAVTDDPFTGPTTDADTNAKRDVHEVLRSAEPSAGKVALFTEKVAGSSDTHFEPPLDAALDLLDGKVGDKAIFFMSDGFPGDDPSAASLARIGTLGVQAHTYAVTSGSDKCVDGGDLDAIADAAGIPCVYVSDPGSLSDVVGQPPVNIEKIEVSIPGYPTQTATVNALGNFSASFTLPAGDYTATATVFYTDKTTQQDQVNFKVVELPDTGADVDTLVLMGAGLLALGVLVVGPARRRSTTRV